MNRRERSEILEGEKWRVDAGMVEDVERRVEREQHTERNHVNSADQRARTEEETEPHYQIVVDRGSTNLDEIEVHVEVEESFFSDTTKNLESLKARGRIVK